ncbi:MAG: hypothetical protein VXZ72_05420 [Chlamydiota bacterium]|nr:hypothetical protein [Chlamydiota bacterium]
MAKWGQYFLCSLFVRNILKCFLEKFLGLRNRNSREIPEGIKEETYALDGTTYRMYYTKDLKKIQKNNLIIFFGGIGDYINQQEGQHPLVNKDCYDLIFVDLLSPWDATLEAKQKAATAAVYHARSKLAIARELNVLGYSMGGISASHLNVERLKVLGVNTEKIFVTVSKSFGSIHGSSWHGMWE